MSLRTSKRKQQQVLDLQAEGMTQGEIAERLGLERSTVARIEIAHDKRRRSVRNSFADDATGFTLHKRPAK